MDHSYIQAVTGESLNTGVIFASLQRVDPDCCSMDVLKILVTISADGHRNLSIASLEVDRAQRQFAFGVLRTIEPAELTVTVGIRLHEGICNGWGVKYCGSV